MLALIFLTLTLAVTPVRKITGWGSIVKVRRALGLLADESELHGAGVALPDDPGDGVHQRLVLPLRLPQHLLGPLVFGEIDHRPFQDRFAFELDPFRRRCLMEGLDEIGITLARDAAISKYEADVAAARPWVTAGSGHEGVAVEGTGRA